MDESGNHSDPRRIPKRAAFTGKIVTHLERLSIPLKRRKPTVYSIWNDLYHESVPFEFIKEVHFQIGIMDLLQYGHTFLVLTKRPQRILEQTFWEDGYTLPDGSHDYDSGTEPMHKLLARPKNLWSGLTVCNQAEADEKIPIFLQVPGKRFLSIEPMLGPIDLQYSAFNGADSIQSLEGIHAVILGGETGPGARPMHPDWVRSIRDQCAAAGVPFFFKQWGEWIAPAELNEDFKNCEHKGASIGPERIKWLAPDGSTRNIGEGQHRDGDKIIVRIGKRTAGRLLDGRTHDDLPWVKS